jgi:Mg2+ and Co2+ transporter CorA
MEHAARTLDRIENDMFSGKERDTVHSISDVGRVLLRFQTTLARHEEPLSTFLHQLSTPAFFGKTFVEHAAHIEGERDHVADLVRSYRAAATELRATNDSLLNASQNEIVKRLTVVAFLVSPITVLASIFSMSITNVPLVHHPHAFWIVIGLGIVGSIVSFSIFKYKKWL